MPLRQHPPRHLSARSASDPRAHVNTNRQRRINATSTPSEDIQRSRGETFLRTVRTEFLFLSKFRGGTCADLANRVFLVLGHGQRPTGVANRVAESFGPSRSDQPRSRASPWASFRSVDAQHFPKRVSIPAHCREHLTSDSRRVDAADRARGTGLTAFHLQRFLVQSRFTDLAPTCHPMNGVRRQQTPLGPGSFLQCVGCSSPCNAQQRHR